MYCTNVFADSHDKENSPKENKEEPLPLNDPFVGDSSFSGGVKVISEDEIKNLYPITDHVHFFGMYIGNFPDLDNNEINWLADIINNV